MRAAGRRERQRKLLQHRTGRDSTDWNVLGSLISAVVMIALNVLAAFVVRSAVDSGERIEAELEGKIVVTRYFLDAVKAVTKDPSRTTDDRSFLEIEGQTLVPPYSSEARRIAEDYGGSKESIEQKLRDAVRDHGARDFISKDDASPGLSAVSRFGPLTAMLGSIALFLWAVMLVFQGEGLELDLQRRRNPMWEWLFSHPVPSGAIFFAEMLSPIAANPVYWGGPLFVGVLYGLTYDAGVGLIATFLIGIPVTIAAACLGKGAGDRSDSSISSALARGHDRAHELAGLHIHDAAVSGRVLPPAGYFGNLEIL